MRDRVKSLASKLKRTKKPALCRHCGEPATCFGTYEETTDFACDNCCGHACEDGFCIPLAGEDAEEPRHE